MPFVAGFGSLMFNWGVNGRGILVRYEKSDLVIADLVGYKRTYEAEIKGNRYLGISEFEDKEEMKINISVFYIPNSGWNAFLASESSHPNQIENDPINYPLYDIKDISSNIRWREEPFTRDPVYACITHCPSVFGKVRKEYHEKVLYGIEDSWGEKELEFFMKTTYWKEGNTVWDTRKDKKSKKQLQIEFGN